MTKIAPWDVVSSPVRGKDILILATPGAGYETLIGRAQRLKLPIFNLADLGGYRADSLHPYSWLINLEKAFYEITVPWNPARIYIGYADNFLAVSSLPWARVVVFNPSWDDLETRIVDYRKRNGLRQAESQDKEDAILANLRSISVLLSRTSFATIDALPDNPRSLLGFLKLSKPEPYFHSRVIEEVRDIQDNPGDGAKEF